jgi:hypothetical protein
VQREVERRQRGRGEGGGEDGAKEVEGRGEKKEV